MFSCGLYCLYKDAYPSEDYIALYGNVLYISFTLKKNICKRQCSRKISLLEMFKVDDLLCHTNLILCVDVVFGLSHMELLSILMLMLKYVNVDKWIQL